MTKRTVLYAIFFSYEIIRLFFIITAQNQGFTDILPLSWYAGLPLFCMGFIFIYMMYKSKKKQMFVSSLFIVQKIATCTGFFVYFITYSDYIKYTPAINIFYSLKLLAFMVIFFTIDVIVCVVIVLLYKGTSKNSVSFPRFPTSF
ncbi:MAG: hypothetical protein R3Y36_04380 [Spirochaetales bacterium]